MRTYVNELGFGGSKRPANEPIDKVLNEALTYVLAIRCTFTSTLAAA
jgi:hypothetical protein